jgi:hypothetical protein
MARRKNKEELPLVDITLTANEMNSLNGETAELWKLYIELSRRRDFATNITGKVTRLNDRTFKEMMEITKKQGRQPKRPTTKHITRWLSQLEALSMIKPLGNYVFFLPKALVDESAKNKCHQSVTKTDEKCHQNTDASVTKSDVNETPVNIAQNKAAEGKVSPENNEKCHQVDGEAARRLGIPLYTLHNITLHDENKNLPVDKSKPNAQDFMQLLARQGYYVNKLHGNKNTLAMVHAWVEGDVSLEEAQIGINHVNQQKGKPPDTPYYYLKPVLQVRSDFISAKKQAQEMTNDATRVRKPPVQPHSKLDRREETRKRMAAWVEKEDDGQEDHTDII